MAATHAVTFKDQSTDNGLLTVDSAVSQPWAPLDLTPETCKNIFEAAELGLVSWIVKTVERTLEFDINQRDRLCRTALHWAAELGHLEVVEALIDFGADPTLVECNGRTALHLAARSGHVDVLKACLANKSRAQTEPLVNQTDNWGITPVFLALQKGEEGRLAFEYLMECGGRYNKTPN